MRIKEKLISFIKGQKPEFMENEAGLIDIIYIAVYLGIAVAAGAITLFITQQVVTITGTPSNSHLSNASSNLLNTADQGYSFLPIVAVAAIGSVAIGYTVFSVIAIMGLCVWFNTGRKEWRWNGLNPIPSLRMQLAV